MNLRTDLAGLAPIFLLLAGCSAAQTSSDAPTLAEDGLAPEQAVTWSTSTMNAATPTATTGGYYTTNQVKASVSWTGSGTYATGACLQVRVEVGGYYDDATREEWSEPVTCTTDSECTSYAAPYTGGAAHCLAPNNTGTAFCYVRPGPQSQFCVGTPANGSLVTVPATRTTAYQAAWNYESAYHNAWVGDRQTSYGEVHWVMQGCYSGCSGGASGTVIKTPSMSAETVLTYQF